MRAQRIDKRARRGSANRRRGDRCGRHGRALCAHLGALGGEYLIENRSHRITPDSARRHRFAEARAAHPFDCIERASRREYLARHRDAADERIGTSADVNRGAGVERETSCAGPGSPASVRRSNSVASFASSVRNPAALAGVRPKSAGAISNVCSSPSFTSTTWVDALSEISSRPSLPCTTIACVDAERGERLGHRSQQPRFGDAEQLAQRTRGIRERRDQIEDRADRERPAQHREARQRRMVSRREDEAASRLSEAALEAGRIEIDLDAEALQHVGGADASADRAIAVLGDRHAGRRRDHRGRRSKC